MSYVLAQQRDSDPVAAFRAYREYLIKNRGRFPRSAYELANSDWYFNPNDHRCPHDAWLESVTLNELSTGSRNEIRSSSLTVRLLGAYHDGHVEFHYPDVRAYQLTNPDATKGQGDWRFDEFRAAEGGRVIHEIEWATIKQSGRWLIEAADVVHKWIPK